MRIDTVTSECVGCSVVMALSSGVCLRGSQREQWYWRGRERLPGITAVLRSLYYPDATYAPPRNTSETEAKSAHTQKTRVRGMVRGTAVDNLFRDFTDRLNKTTLRLADVITVLRGTCPLPVNSQNMGRWTQAQRTNRSLASAWPLFVRGVNELYLKSLHPVATAVPVVCPRAGVCTQVDVICRDIEGRVVLVEIKCGYANWTSDTGRMERPFHAFTDCPKYRSHLQLSVTLRMAQITVAMGQVCHPSLGQTPHALVHALILHIKNEHTAVIEPLNATMWHIVARSDVSGLITPSHALSVKRAKPKPKRRLKTSAPRAPSKKKLPKKRSSTPKRIGGGRKSTKKAGVGKAVTARSLLKSPKSPRKRAKPKK